LHREQRADRHWQRKLFPERRWLLDASQEGPAATGFEIFQANAEVTRRRCSWNKHDYCGLFTAQAVRSARVREDHNGPDDTTSFGASGFALLVTSATFAQQQSPTVRVRGTIEGVDGPMLTVKSRDGLTTYKGKLADNVAVRGIIKAALSDRRQPEGRGNPHFP